MNNIEIIKVFNEEDKRFNRLMVDYGQKFQQGIDISDKHGGKMYINNPYEDDLLKERDYDFTSDVIEAIRNKWGLSK